MTRVRLLAQRYGSIIFGLCLARRHFQDFGFVYVSPFCVLRSCKTQNGEIIKGKISTFGSGYAGLGWILEATMSLAGVIEYDIGRRRRAAAVPARKRSNDAKCAPAAGDRGLAGIANRVPVIAS